MHFKPAIARRVVIGLVDGTTLTGTLTVELKGSIRLENACLVDETTGQETEIPGEVFVLTDKILWLQVP